MEGLYDNLLKYFLARIKPFAGAWLIILLYFYLFNNSYFLFFFFFTKEYSQNAYKFLIRSDIDLCDMEAKEKEEMIFDLTS